VDHEPLGRDARLAVVDGAGGDRGRRRLLDLRRGQHHERVAAAELEHALLDAAGGPAADRGAGALAAGERHRRDARVVDQPFHFARGDEQRPKAARRIAGAPEQLFDRERRLRHVRGVLQERDVARHERRRREAHDLPEREVPRHHGEDRAERLVTHEAVAGVGRDALVGEEALRVLGVEAADPGALFDFADRSPDRLAHLERHRLGETPLVALEDRGGRVELLGALGKRGLAPGAERRLRTLEGRLDDRLVVLVVTAEDLAGGGVHGGHRHRVHSGSDRFRAHGGPGIGF
jgi:hypothetical protein